MKLSSILIKSLPFMAMASAGLVKRQEEDPCGSDGTVGPSNEAKAAVAAYAKTLWFGSGTFCPQGDPAPGGSPPRGEYCAICQDAYLSIQNSGSQGAGRCLTSEQLDASLGNFPEGGNVCVDNVEGDQYLQVLLALPASIYEGENCPNKC